MPLFLYRNPNTQEILEIVQSVHEEHVYVDKNGLKWEREFTIPNATISSSSNLNPNDSKAFVEMTKNKKGSYGDLLDLSKELSEKREKQMGKDAVKEQKFEEYSAARNGKEHPLKKKEKLDKLKKEGIKLKLK